MLAGAWMIASFVVVYGVGDGLVRGGALAFDLVLPYVIARASVFDLADIRRILVIFAPGLFLAGLTLPIEAFARTPLVRPFFGGIFGQLPVYEGGEVIAAATRKFSDERFGLLRALGPFPHPILAGIALGTLGSLYLASGIRGWPRLLGGLCVLAVFFTLSSAAFLSVLLGIFFLFYDQLQRRVSFLDWRKLVFSGSLAFALVQLVTTNGVFGIIQRFSLVPQTAYFRRLIWRYGFQSVQDNWLVGIGFRPYQRPDWMPPSVDNHWLMLAIRHGIAVPLLLLAVVAFTVAKLSVSSVHAETEADRATISAISWSLFSAAALAATVALFGGAQVWFMGLLAFGVALTSVGMRTGPPAKLPRAKPVLTPVAVR